MCKMTSISLRLNLKNFILISFAILELLRKVSQGGGGGIGPPTGEIGLRIKGKLSLNEFSLSNDAAVIFTHRLNFCLKVLLR